MQQKSVSSPCLSSSRSEEGCPELQAQPMDILPSEGYGSLPRLFLAGYRPFEAITVRARLYKRRLAECLRIIKASYVGRSSMRSMNRVASARRLDTPKTLSSRRAEATRRLLMLSRSESKGKLSPSLPSRFEDEGRSAPIHDTGAKGLAVETAETSIENMGHLRSRNKARVQDPRRSRSP